MHGILWGLTLVVGLTSALEKLNTVYEWKYADYVWPNAQAKEEAIRNGDYNYTKILMTDADQSQDGRVFIAINGGPGVPARLATVSTEKGPGGPLLAPYPDWSWFKKGDCKGITGVYRVAIDECNRLWVLDAGNYDIPHPELQCPTQLLAFDLKTNQLLHRIVMPKNISHGDNGMSLLATPIVETEGNACRKTAVFMADTYGAGIIVWDSDSRKLRRLAAPEMEAKKDALDFISGNSKITFADGGPVGMALTPRLFPDEPRYLYFRPLSSFELWAADTRVLRNIHNGNRIKFTGSKDIFKPTSQPLGQAFSSEGTLFLGMSKENALGCYNHYRPMESDNVELLVQDKERLEYINGVKVLPVTITKGEEKLLIFSDKLIAFITGNVNFDEINFRVLKGSVKDLIKGTKCELPSELRDELQIFRRHRRCNHNRRG